MEIFSKDLSGTDITRRCVVPMKYFNSGSFPKPSLGKHQKDFVVKDEDGRDWILGCSIRRIGNDPNRPKHKKPVLIKQWVPFVRSKKLCKGDRVIMYYETGSMRLRIKVEKRTCPDKARPFMNQNNEENKDSSSTSHSSTNESTVSRTTETTTPGMDKEHITTTCGTSQDMATRHKPRLGLSLDFTPEPTTTWRTPAATSASIGKKPTPTFHSHSQDISCCCSTETPDLSLNLGSTLRTTYMQETEPTTIDFLGRFS